MKLNPKRPPGRTNRKARAFSSEIARLHVEGYGLAAIREALADAGVIVSKSTVQREVAKVARTGPPALLGSIVAEPPRVAHSPAASTPIAHDLPNEPRSGKDIAEAFVKGRITNPLFRARN